MSLSKITRNGQVTIPKSIREAFQLAEGDYVDIVLQNDVIIMRPKKVKIVDAAPEMAWKPETEASPSQAPEGHPQRFKVWVGWDPEQAVWVAYVPALNHVSARGGTRDEALANAQEAIMRYLGVTGKTVRTLSVGDASEMVEVELP
jgi:AbrB family looped-hinge helix DNA binding protein